MRNIVPSSTHYAFASVGVKLPAVLRTQGTGKFR